ncbi:MAG: peptidoglycan DD-metalloendopeptidase family protein [Gemmatimonadaceae bacterium]|nr:peptidoglycan DD-metalloendopeptidase family protein [Gemmatimonadaceae bacterium]
MPPQRRWTFLVVPHGSDSPRGFSLSEKLVKRLAIFTSAVGLVAAAGIGVALSHVALKFRHTDDRSLLGSVSMMQARLDSLDDTLRAIGRRDQQIRLLAGLSADSSAQRRDSSGGPTLAIGGVTEMTVGSSSDIDGMIKRANSLAASFAEVSGTLAHNSEKMARIPSIMPTAGWLSSNFSLSRFHPILHYARPHEGIDVSAPMGAPIVAPAGGIVRLVTVETGYGNVLEIDHGDGIVTKYAHCSRIVVKAGQKVKRGQIIANVGSTGLSTGPHVHYEIHVNGKVVDPLTYVLPEGAIPD